MPLYAFDGTWNLDKPGTEHDTNVVWFHDAYTGPKHYFKGIGTRFGALGHIIDVVGFSRGAALALEFANKVCDKGCEARFLGIWDCVPSFGVAAIPLIIGWDLDLPDAVRKCFHAVAPDG